MPHWVWACMDNKVSAVNKAWQDIMTHGIEYLTVLHLYIAFRTIFPGRSIQSEIVLDNHVLYIHMYVCVILYKKNPSAKLVYYLTCK